MKRVVYLAVILSLLVVATAVPRGAPEDPAARPITLTGMVRDYSLNYDPPWYTAVERFQEKYPHVTIELEGLPYDDQREKVLITVGAGRGPDFVMMDCIWLGEFAANDIVIDITDKLAADYPGLMDDYLETFQESARWEGNTYGLWLWTDVRMLAYHKPMLEAAGLDPERPPRTWNELREYARQLNRPEDDVWGYAFPAFSTDHTADRWYPLLWMGGGQILTDDMTEAAFNSEAGIQALQFLVDLMNEDEVSPKDLIGISEADISRGFLAERYAMMIKVGEFWPDYEDMGYSVDEYKAQVRHAPLPLPEGGQPATGSGGWLGAVTRDSEHPDLALEFITMVAETANMAEFLLIDGRTPTRQSLVEMEEEFFEAVPYFDVQQEVLPYARFRPYIPEYTMISAEIVEAIQAALALETTPEAALNRAAERVNAILAEREW